MVSDMLSQGVITPSQSPWASPIVLVRKKDGGIRFCVDYRRLNQATKLDEFPLPRIDDTLDLLAGTRYFSTLDLASGYWQVGMEQGSQEKTAFRTYVGLYEFVKMPFGLVNAPATFDLFRRCVVVGRTLEEHNANLAEVPKRIQAAGLKLKPRKCNFAQTEVTYLGHVISARGVRTDPEKIKAVQEFPTPTNFKTLQPLLGLVQGDWSPACID